MGLVEALIAIASVSSIIARQLPEIVDELHQKNRLTDDEKALVMSRHQALLASHAAMTDEQVDAEQNAISDNPPSAHS